MKDLKDIPYESTYDRSLNDDFEFITIDDLGEVFLSWSPRRVTKVTGFEIESFSPTGEVEGTLLSLKCGNEEQLIDQPPLGVLLYENIILPVIDPGICLTLKVRGFRGKIRPLGVKVVPDWQPPPEILHTTCDECGIIKLSTDDECHVCELRRASKNARNIGIAFGVLNFLGLALMKWTPIVGCLSVVVQLFFLLHGFKAFLIFRKRSPSTFPDAMKFTVLRLIAPIVSLWDYRFGLVILAVDALMTAVFLTALFNDEKKTFDGSFASDD